MRELTVREKWAEVDRIIENIYRKPSGAILTDFEEYINYNFGRRREKRNESTMQLLR